MKLFQFTPFPPGGFPYEQTFNGKTYKWPDEGLDIEQQSARILQFRRANRVPRRTLAEVIEDLSEFTCARLGNDPTWCGNGRRTAKVQRVERRGCGGCGARV